ncbi:hypothetical protein PG993_012203 [Apiospora rasikravindrae]|uniref:2EXR domain-containing protein n=1 Tax=Apiospora rasikravindrae TaxID=990691 RepID=A0ABR1S1S0_9PEZI
MKFQAPDDANADMKDAPRYFDTVSIIPTKRSHSAAFYNADWIPRKRRIIIPEEPLLLRKRLGKRQRAGEDESNPVKRRVLFEAAHSGLVVDGRLVVPPQTGPWLLDGQAGDVNVEDLADMVKGLKIEKAFPQFSRLPPELRRLIWQHTWEHRVVTISRRIVAFKRGIPDPTRSEDPHYEAEPPVSLFVNFESRHETLLHFQTAFALDGNDAKIYFNPSLDSLNLPRHHPLGLCFEINDLQKLTSITVPELFPALPSFKKFAGPWDFHLYPAVKNAQIPPVVDGTVAHYPEFDRAWQLLRWRFPNLREINLEPVSDCKLHDSAPVFLGYTPLDILANPDPRLVDQCCLSCHNLQRGAARRFRQIGRNTSYLECIFDAYGFFGPPTYERKNVVVGTVKREGRKDEDVTVSFWRIKRRREERQYEFCLPSLPGPKPQPRAGQNELALPAYDSQFSYELKCIAKSLERFLGPPTDRDCLALEI